MKKKIEFVINPLMYISETVESLPSLISERFYILPYIPRQFRERVVYLPSLKNFVTTFRDIEHIKNFKSEIYRRNILKIIKKLNIKEQILLVPQIYGTLGSYYLQENKIVLRPRIDRSPEEVAKLLITAFSHFQLFKNSDTDNHNVFTEVQEKSENLYKKIFTKKNIQNTQKILKTKYSGKYAIESAKHIYDLGLKIHHFVNKSNDIKGLTLSEQSILSLLCKNRNELVTNEAIFLCLQSSKEFSLYAISKNIGRIREKLRDSGICSELIHPYRGRGYVLYD